MSKRKISIITGVSILIMAIAAGIGYGFIHSQIFQKGNIGATFEAFQDNKHLFSVSIIAWVVIIITDLIVSWGLFAFVKPTDHIKAIIIGGLRIVYTCFLIFAVSLLFKAYSLSSPEAIYNHLLAFERVWHIGLIVFGVHLYYLGRTACYNKLLPKIWCGLLVLAGLSYVIVSVGKVWFESNYWVVITEQILTLPMAVSELGLAIWMIERGGK